jgi:hypothetical protein
MSIAFCGKLTSNNWTSDDKCVFSKPSNAVVSADNFEGFYG